MELEIIVCDDLPAIAEGVSNKIKAILLSKHPELFLEPANVLVTAYSNSFKALLDKIALKSREKCFAYFLDIDLKQAFDGIQLARQIRSIDPDGCIIFLTHYEQYMPKVFENHLKVLDYIGKDTLQANMRLEKAIGHIVDQFTKTLNGEESSACKIKFTFQNSWMMYAYDLDHILYFLAEGNRKLILFTTSNQAITFYGTLKEIEKKWENKGLVRCHKECVVNISKVVRVVRWKDDPHIVLNNGAKCKVSKTYLDRIIKQVAYEGSCIVGD